MTSYYSVLFDTSDPHKGKVLSVSAMSHGGIMTLNTILFYPSKNIYSTDSNIKHWIYVLINVVTTL